MSQKGWLRKKGYSEETGKLQGLTWDRRYFVLELEEGVIKYYSKEKCEQGDFKGTLSLLDAEAFAHPDTDKQTGPNCFKVVGKLQKKKGYMLRCESPAERTQWMEAIATATTEAKVKAGRVPPPNVEAPPASDEVPEDSVLVYGFTATAEVPRDAICSASIGSTSSGTGPALYRGPHRWNERILVRATKGKTLVIEMKSAGSGKVVASTSVQLPQASVSAPVAVSCSHFKCLYVAIFEEEKKDELKSEIEKLKGQIENMTDDRRASIRRRDDIEQALKEEMERVKNEKDEADRLKQEAALAAALEAERRVEEKEVELQREIELLRKQAEEVAMDAEMQKIDAEVAKNRALEEAEENKERAAKLASQLETQKNRAEKSGADSKELREKIAELTRKANEQENEVEAMRLENEKTSTVVNQIFQLPPSLRFRRSPNYTTGEDQTSVLHEGQFMRYATVVTEQGVAEGVFDFTIRLLQSTLGDVMIGAAPSSIDEAMGINYKQGWFLVCRRPQLCGPDGYKDAPAERGEEPVGEGSRVNVRIDMNRKEILFGVNDGPLFPGFGGLPADRSVLPCVLLGNGKHSIEISAFEE